MNKILNECIKLMTISNYADNIDAFKIILTEFNDFKNYGPMNISSFKILLLLELNCCMCEVILTFSKTIYFNLKNWHIYI